jgi:hypothetical protein
VQIAFYVQSHEMIEAFQRAQVSGEMSRIGAVANALVGTDKHPMRRIRYLLFDKIDEAGGFLSGDSDALAFMHATTSSHHDRPSMPVTVPIIFQSAFMTRSVNW